MTEPILNSLKPQKSQKNKMLNQTNILIQTFKGRLTDQEKLKALSLHLKVHPSEISILKGPNGKPRIERPKAPFHYNVSHSSDYTLFAISQNEVGIDLERLRENLDQRKISRRLFSDTLVNWLESFETERSLKLFFKAWTFYEAFLKAQGLTIFSGERIKEKFVFDSPDQKELTLNNYFIYEIEAPAGYVAAVASKIKNPEIKYLKI
jgi:4'-phosphopantetheinyl transferase